MNREEIKQTIKILSMAYPRAYRDMSTEEKQGMLSLWEMHFSEAPKVVMSEAIKNYTAVNEYPPTIAGLKKQVDMILRDGDDKAELWKAIIKAAGNSSYNYVEEFEKLPEPCKKFVGTPNALKEFGVMDTGTLNTVIKGQFYKQVDEIMERQEVQEKLPPKIKQMLSQSNLIEERREDDRQIP